MTIYGAIQEQATFMMYKHQLGLARERGDNVLASIYGFIARDEAAHADFYRRVVQLELEEDRPGTLRDMALVFKNFRMPGTDLVPDYAARTEQMRATGGVDRGTFLKEVWFPTLKKLAVSRHEVTRALTELRQAELRIERHRPAPPPRARHGQEHVRTVDSYRCGWHRLPIPRGD